MADHAPLLVVGILKFINEDVRNALLKSQSFLGMRFQKAPKLLAYLGEIEKTMLPAQGQVMAMRALIASDDGQA